MQHTAGQLRNRKASCSSGAKVFEHADVVTFADVAGVDEAKEELEEIVVCRITFVEVLVAILLYLQRSLCTCS